MRAKPLHELGPSMAGIDRSLMMASILLCVSTYDERTQRTTRLQYPHDRKKVASMSSESSLSSTTRSVRPERCGWLGGPTMLLVDLPISGRSTAARR
jgi:hypothetical protein